jgi:hypothetical protein
VESWPPHFGNVLYLQALPIVMQETKFVMNLSMWRYFDHNTKENKEVEDICKILKS